MRYFKILMISWRMKAIDNKQKKEVITRHKSLINNCFSIITMHMHSLIVAKIIYTLI